MPSETQADVQHRWSVTRTTDDDLWFEDYLSAVLSHTLQPLPPREQKVGVSTVRWWEGRPGDAIIMAEGGSVDDRWLAEQVVKESLAIHGYQRVAFDVDGSEEMRRTADWDEVAEKAKRLMQSGNVTLLRNGYNNVVAHVVGDHGEYNCEIGRDDPNSRAISTWTCECPWDQYAWGRTRQWKKYEGRPCAHVMAALWTAQGTPLDEQLSEDQAQNMGTGQAIGPGAGTPLPGAGGPAPPLPAGTPQSFGPDGEPIQGDQQDLFKGDPELEQAAQTPYAQQPLAPPASPDVIPPFPGDQEQLQFPVPGQTPGGGPSPPGAVSVPGAKPQTPYNPIQYPGGTYSSNPYPALPYLSSSFQTMPRLTVPEDWHFSASEIPPQTKIILKNDAYGLSSETEVHGTGGYHVVPKGTAGEVLAQDPTTGWIECSFDLTGGELTPHSVRVFLEPKDVNVSPASPQQGAFPRNIP